MAKKLGILALVVCMLLSVAAVASAADNCENGDNPYKENTQSFKPHFFAKPTLAGDTQVCSECGALWGDDNGTAHKAASPSCAGSGSAKNLSDFRKETTKLAKVDEEYAYPTAEFAGTSTGANKSEDAGAVKKAKEGKDHWTVYEEEVHKQGQASGAIYRRECAYCHQYEQIVLQVEHDWAFIQPADDKRTECGVDQENVPVGDLRCTVCGQTNTKPVTMPGLAHDWKNVTVLQSCTTGGGKGDVCQRCGALSNEVLEAQYDGEHKFVPNESEPLGHDWVFLSISKPVTAGTLQEASDGIAEKVKGAESKANIEDYSTELGCQNSDTTVIYVCNRASCSKDITSTTAATLKKITIGNKENIEGTLDHAADGRVTLSFKPSEKTDGHVFGKITYKPATCDLKGRNTQTCLICGLEQITEAFANAPAKGHVGDGIYRHDDTTHEGYAAGVGDGKSMHYQLCTACGAKCFEESCKSGDGEGKAADFKATTIDANCTTGASAIFECGLCHYKENVVDPAEDNKKLDAKKVTTPEHHYGYQANGKDLTEANLAKWTTKKVTEAAACNKPGTAEYTCKYCNKVALTKAIPGEHDMVRQSTTLTDCTQQWVEIWICSREDCPGVSVKPAESGEETLHDDVKLTWTATITTDTGKEDGRVVQRRIYTAQKAHDFTNPKYEVVKEPTCVQNGERYPLCNICGKKGPKDDEGFKATGVHDYTAKGALVPADCTHPERKGQICKMCGQPKPGTQPEDVENSKPLGHDYANPLYFVNTSVELAEADARKADYADLAVAKPTECDKAYVVRTDCTRCDAFNIEKHPAGSHSWSKERVHKAPTCDENDRDVYVCTVCGTENPQGKIDNYQNAGGFGIADESLKATGHDYGAYEVLPLSASAAANQTKHVRTCKTCGHKDEDACVYDKNKDESKDATCVNVSVTAMTCKTCKNTYMVYGVDLDPDNHDFEQVPVEGREPTCTEIGLVLETCPNCGATGRTIEIKGLGHAWERATGNWTTGLVITQEPTCVADGVAHRVCEFCGLTTEDFTVGKYDGANTQFGHTWTRADYVWSADQLIVDVEPTCTVDGTGHYVCADCGYELTTGIPHYDGASTPWGHTWNRPDYVWSIDQLTISTEPTCVADGEGYYECSDCGYKLVVPVPHYDGANTPYGHVWAHEAWPAGLVVNEDGTYYYQCSDCGYLFQEQ